MSKSVYVFLADGFEEGEAVIPVDIMRRAGIEVTLVSITEEKLVVSSHGVKVLAERSIGELGTELPDGVFLPGGMPGAVNLSQCWALNEMILRMNAEGRLVSAICASPSVVLANLMILDGRDATCYPGCEKYSKKRDFIDSGVVVDGNIITGMSVGYAPDMALEIVSYLLGGEKADEIYDEIIPGGEDGYDDFEE